MWRPSPEETAQILRRVVCVTPVPVSDPGGHLGYGGFSIRNLGDGAGRPSEIRVRDGIIAIFTVGGVRYWADSCGLEQYLLQMARLRGAFPAGFKPHYYG